MGAEILSAPILLPSSSGPAAHRVLHAYDNASDYGVFAFSWT